LKWQNVIDQFGFRHGVRAQWCNMKLLDITSSIYKSFPVDPKVIENAVLYFIESQALVLSPSPKAETVDFLNIVPKIWEGILKAFRYYWTLRGGMRMKLTRSLIEMLAKSENVNIRRVSAQFIKQLGDVIKEAARINFMRVKDSIPGEFSLSKLNEILKACVAELSSDAKMFEPYQNEEESAFTGVEYFKSIAKMFWFGGVEVSSIDGDGNITTAEPHNCLSREAIVLTGCLPDWMAPNQVLYANTTSPCSMSLFKSQSIPGKQILKEFKPEKGAVMRASKLGSGDKSVEKTVDIQSVSLSTGVFVTASDHGLADGDRVSLSGYVPYPFFGKKFMFVVIKESEKRSFMLSLVQDTQPSVSLFYKTYLRKETEIAMLPMLEDKLNSETMMIDETVFDLYSTIEEVWEFFVQHNVVSNMQKVSFEAQFKSLFLKWTLWVDNRLREMILNAMKEEKPLADDADAIICTSTEDTMTMVRLFLSKYLTSDLGRRYTPIMLEKFGGAFAFYVDRIQARAVAELSQIENTWGKRDDPIYNAIKNGRAHELRDALKPYKKEGLNLSQWVGASAKDTRGGVFHVAAKYRQYDDGLLQLLKDEKCHPNSQDSLRRTCVHTFAEQMVKQKIFGENSTSSESEAMKFLNALIDMFPDVNVNMLDYTNQTPLQILSASTSESEFIKDARRKLEALSNGEDQTLFSSILGINFCAHVNSINYILNNAPTLMQEHAEVDEEAVQDDKHDSDLIYNVLRSLRKHCRTMCSLVLKRAFQILCNAVVTPVLKHVISGTKVKLSDVDKAKAGISAGIKAIKSLVPGAKADAAAEQSQPKYFDREIVQRDSNYVIKAVQEQMNVPILCFITEGDRGPLNERVKKRRLKFIKDVMLPELWNSILEAVETLLLPILNEESDRELSIYDAKLLQKLVFENLPLLFALYDDESQVSFGLDDDFFKRHPATNRLKILFALYCVPVRRLCDMHGKLLHDEGVRRAWNIQPVDILRIIRSRKNKHEIAKEYLKNSGSQNEDWELCLRFKIPDTERRVSSFSDIAEISGSRLLANECNLYIFTSYIVCEWSKASLTKVKDPLSIRLSDLKLFEHEPPATSTDKIKLHIHYTSGVLDLLVKSAPEIIIPARQAAFYAGNRRVKVFLGTADERQKVKSRFDLSSDEVLVQQQSCVLSDVTDQKQKSGSAYLFTRCLIFEAESSINILNRAAFKLIFNFEKTTFSCTGQPVMKCRREDGETYNMRFSDQQICSGVCKHCDEAKEVMAKEKLQVNNLIKLWLPADEGLGGQSSKTFKILPDDSIRGLIEQVRAKMAIDEDEILRVAIEGPIPFQPGLEELVAARRLFLSAASSHVICRW
jgi:hypothetical protein